MQSEDSSKASACARCHRRKTRCDKAQPTCSSCAKSGLSCAYSFRGPVHRQRDVEALERRVQQLDAQNKVLATSLRAGQGRASILSTFEANDAGDTSNDTTRRATGSSVTANNSEVANEVSTLSLHAGADQQFLGSASGMLLGQLLQVERRSVNQAQQDEASQTSHQYAVAQNDHRGAATPDIGSLPSEKLARSLLSAYLSHDHLCYPFLHPCSLTDALDAVYADESFYGNNPVDAFIIDMVLAIGTAQVYKYDWQVLPDAETHHQRAVSRLVPVLSQGGIVALQAILLLCQYRMLSSLYETSASLWHLVGTAARMCFELGMHRESTYKVSQNSASSNMQSLQEASEIKRRCFWCIFALDRIASITLGRPLAIHLDDIDTELPQAEPVSGGSPDAPLSPTQSFDSPQWQSRTAIFVHIVQYRIICGKILSSLHNATRKRPHTDYSSTREEFAQELQTWYRESDHLPLVDANSPWAKDRSSFRSRDWYRMLFHNGILILYRPSSTFQDSLQTSAILQRIFESAQQSIAAYSYLHRTRKINYSWVTLHAVFIAGLSYIYAVRSHFQTRRSQSRFPAGPSDYSPGAQLPSDPTVIAIMNDTRACSTVLVAVSERWASARNCHVVFGRLSDAVLADVVDFYSIANYPAQSGNLRQARNEQHSEDTSSAGFQNITTHMDPFSFGADLAKTYQDCFNDVNQMYDGSYYNEPTMQVSQDWLLQIQALNEVF